MLPEAEHRFRELLADWHGRQGVGRDSPVFDRVVDADGPATYGAGGRIARELAGFVPLEHCRILDVGCGFNGALIALARAGACCVGVDLDVERLALGLERQRWHGTRAAVACGSAFGLPFRDGHFDVVIGSELLEHVPSRREVVRELVRVLRKGGLLYLAFPNLLSLDNACRDPHHFLPGLTLLPRPLAELYVQALRHRPLDVETLPTAWGVARLCRKLGIAACELTSSEAVLLDRIAHPQTIRNSRARALVSGLVALGLRPLLRLAVRVRATCRPSAVLVGLKS